jgi:hypothetical protein
MSNFKYCAKACRQMARTVVDPKMRDTLLELAAVLEADAIHREPPTIITPTPNGDEEKETS